MANGNWDLKQACTDIANTPTPSGERVSTRLPLDVGVTPCIQWLNCKSGVLQNSEEIIPSAGDCSTNQQGQFYFSISSNPRLKFSMLAVKGSKNNLINYKGLISVNHKGISTTFLERNTICFRFKWTSLLNSLFFSFIFRFRSWQKNMRTKWVVQLSRRCCLNLVLPDVFFLFIFFCLFLIWVNFFNFVYVWFEYHNFFSLLFILFYYFFHVFFFNHVTSRVISLWSRDLSHDFMKRKPQVWAERYY